MPVIVSSGTIAVAGCVDIGVGTGSFDALSAGVCVFIELADGVSE